MKSKEEERSQSCCTICDTIKEYYKNHTLSLRKAGSTWTKRDTKAMVLLFLFLIGWFTFETKIIKWVDEEIASHYVKHAEYSKVVIILTIILISGFVIKRFPTLLRSKMFTPYRYLLYTVTFSFLYFKYRLTGVFAVKFEYYSVGILDVLFTAIFIYSLFLLVLNFVGIKKEEIKKEVLNTEKKGLIDFELDHYIKDSKDDLFNFSVKVKALLKQIKRLDENPVFVKEKSFSIGIVGKWGYGKSSYLYLLEKEINDKPEDYILVKFNPRHSKNVNTIQFDFFQAFYGELKQYDSRFSKSFNTYLKAIQVVDSKGILDFIEKGYTAFFNVEDEKEIINHSIQRIGKKIIVIIDDLDRLLADEIIEVFKIIDGTASFANTVFITAYDKEHINKIIDEKYSNEDTFFSDKFFNVEKFLPAVKKSIIVDYIKDSLKKYFSSESDTFDLEMELSNLKFAIEENIHTLRDAKRFLNTLQGQFYLVRDKLIFREYFLLCLIKYRWYDEYIFIQKEMFSDFSEMDMFFGHNIAAHEVTFSSANIIKKLSSSKGKEIQFHSSKEVENKKQTLQEKEDEREKQIEERLNKSLVKILKKLFVRNDNEDSICNIEIFDFYFEENEDIDEYEGTGVYFKNLLDKGLKNIKGELDNYFEQKNTDRLFNHIENRRFEAFKNEESLYVFIDILFYLNIRSNNDVRIFKTILMFLNNEIIKERLSHETESNIDSFKTNLKAKVKSKLRKSTPSCPYLFYKEFLLYILHRNIEELFLFDRAELLNVAKENLNVYATKENIYSDQHLQLLNACCIGLTENKEAILDKGSCLLVKELIIENPTEYFKYFVRLELCPPSFKYKSIISEPFWSQIFESPDEFEEFINDSVYDDDENIELVRNFWILFKYNSYESIEYIGEGDVQEKINNGLKEEVKSFIKLKTDLLSLLKHNVLSLWEAFFSNSSIKNDRVINLEVGIQDENITYLNLYKNKVTFENVLVSYEEGSSDKGEVGSEKLSKVISGGGEFEVSSIGIVTVKKLWCTSSVDVIDEIK